MKKEKYNYFDEFCKVTEYIKKSANELEVLVKNYNNEKLEKSIDKIHKLEHASDHVVHDMREYLIKDFLPPIDREDIALIINKLDDIEDGIDEIAICFKIFNIERIKNDVLELLAVLVKSTEAVSEMFGQLSNLKHLDIIKQKIIIVNKLEESGDRVYEKLLSNLYKEEKNSIDLVKWLDIYKEFEETIDSCETIGDCIQDVIMKNS